jgi:hypothetical protein
MEVIGIGVGKSEFTGISLVSVSAKIWLSLTKDFIQFFQTYLITDTLLIKLLEALNASPSMACCLIMHEGFS